MDEECMVCHEPTGKAGRDEDSLYTPNGIGPFCEQCWDDAWPVMVPNAAPAPALLALASVRLFLKNERAWLRGTTADAGRAAATDASIAALEAALLAPDGAGEVATDA